MQEPSQTRSGDAIPVVTAEDLLGDPHGLFRQYRSKYPFVRRQDGIAIVLRAADVRQLFTDPRTRQFETEGMVLHGILDGPLFDFIKYNMLASNGEAHQRRRSPFVSSFAFKLMREMRPVVRQAAVEILDGLKGRQEIDFLDRFASVLPARVISRMLGLPEADIPHFTSVVYSLSRILNSTLLPEDVPGMQQAAGELLDYAERLVEAGRRKPRSEFLTSILASIDQKAELSPIEIVVQIASLIVGGSDTTRGALAIMTALLLRHREQWDAVCEHPEFIPSAVAEALRYEPIVGSVQRIVLADIDLDGHRVPPGSLIDIAMISALRDEALYDDPDRFDIRRPQKERWHLGFGGGGHRCLGEALARVEMEESLAALTELVPGLRLIGDPPSVFGYGGLRRVGAMTVAPLS